MIEINLIQKKKKKKGSAKVMGVDLSSLNWKAIIFAAAIWYAQDLLLEEFFKEKEKSLKDNIQVKTTQLNKKKKELKKHASVKEKLNAYNRRIKILQKRTNQVKKIMSIRTNPKKLLERVAKSVPDDMWFEKLEVNENREIIIKGKVEAYRSIGDFLSMINESAFVGKSMTLVNYATKDEVLFGVEKRVEEFEIKGQVKTFDPWQTN